MYMLRLNNIKKVYEVENFKQVALDDVTLNFRQTIQTKLKIWRCKKIWLV